MPGQEEHIKPVFSVTRLILKILIILIAFVVTTLLSLLVLLYVYEDEIKTIVIKELNKHLDAEVKVDPKNIDVTVIRTFPDCSVEFKQALMLEALKSRRRDTLLFAEKLNLCFNIKDIWNGTYNIQKIKLYRGLINLRILKNGQANYYFWKSEPVVSTKAKADSLSFRLEMIEAKDCRLRYRDYESEIKTELFIRTIRLKGNFHNEDYELKTTGDCRIEHFVYENKSYLKEKNCEFDISFDVKGDDYQLSKASLKINRMTLELNGRLRYKDDLEFASIGFFAPKLDISAFLSLMPGSFRGRINDYESDGKFYIKGNYNYRKRGPYKLDANFGIKGGEITYRPNSAHAENVSMKGRIILSPTQTLLDLKDLRMNLGTDRIKGDLIIKNFNDPYLKINAEADLMLEKLMNFYPIDTLSQLSGKVQLKSNFEGRLEDLKTNTFGSSIILNMEANIQNLITQFKGDEKVSSIETCSVLALNREVEVRNCKLVRGNSDVTVSGKIPGLFNYISDRSQPLIIKGSLHSDNFHLEDFMIKYLESEDKNAPIIPSNIYFNLDANIGHFTYARFKADDISGDFEIKNQKAIASDVRLKVMEGEAEINAYFDNSKQKLDVVLQSQLNHINMTQLFYQFNNFGQTTLTENNLNGFATAQVDLSGSWSNALDPDYNSIRSTINLTIDKGMLIDFQPMLSLSNFVEVKDLKQIRFSTLQSQVDIHDQTIYFPKTSIKSSAMNLEFWGKHGFDNRIEYHIQLLISELLAKRRKAKSSEFGEVINDPENRRSAFILMTGTVDNPVIKYDKSGLKEKIKSDIKEENQNLKQLLKDEFGLFKKDTLVRKKKTEESKFELEKPVKPAVKKPLEPKKKTEEEDDF